MRRALAICMWVLVLGVVVFAVANPERGVIYQSPMAALGVGMIGLGLCIEARGRLAPAYATRRRRKVKQ